MCNYKISEKCFQHFVESMLQGMKAAVKGKESILGLAGVPNKVSICCK